MKIQFPVTCDHIMDSTDFTEGFPQNHHVEAGGENKQLDAAHAKWTRVFTIQLSTPADVTDAAAACRAGWSDSV